jgi:phosphatidylinositol kinase/protein kinase (PI-3  family)
MAKNLKVIPPAAFYTAIPQLVSRVVHRNNETALIVKKILERVLFKFPLQAMWHLAWLKGSKNSDRSRIGEEIFKEAQAVLIKTKHTDMAKILQASSSLFKFLQELARYVF